MTTTPASRGEAQVRLWEAGWDLMTASPDILPGVYYEVWEHPSGRRICLRWPRGGVSAREDAELIKVAVALGETEGVGKNE